MQLLQDAVIQIVHGVSQLIRVLPDVVERDEARDKLAIKKIVRIVDGSRAPIRVVVGIGTGTKGSQRPERGNFPMIVVLFETIHVLNVALVMTVFPHPFLLFFGHFVLFSGAVEHGQIPVADVVPTEIAIFAGMIRRLNRRQHIQQIPFRFPERSVAVVQRRRFHFW